MKATILNIATESIHQATMEACMYDRTATLANVLLEAEILVSSLKFDTLIASNMFMGLVVTEIQKQAPYLVNKMGMDKNGNYTSNQKLWA